MNIKTIDIPIFRGKLTFTKSESFKETNERYKLQIPERFGAVTFRNENADGFECVVSFVDDNISLLVHEAVHVCNFIYEKIGAKLDIENDEFQAYLIGWIVDEMLIFLNKKDE